MLHTGDITQLAKAEEFDTANEVLKGITNGSCRSMSRASTTSQPTTAPHTSSATAKGTKGGGWYSFDHTGVHFIGLVNVLNLKAGGLGSLGAEQIAWLKNDVARLASSTPIVLFAHVPLWTVYPEWGWGTDDSEQALGLLKRFGSVTVLNGHIHQIMQKVEGNMSFHTAMSTAFPQPDARDGTGPGSDEGRSGKAQERAWHRERDVHSGPQHASRWSTPRCRASRRRSRTRRTRQ